MKKVKIEGYQWKLSEGERALHYAEYLKAEGDNDAQRYKVVADIFGRSTYAIRASVLKFKNGTAQESPELLFDYKQEFA